MGRHRAQVPPNLPFASRPLTQNSKQCVASQREPRQQLLCHSQGRKLAFDAHTSLNEIDTFQGIFVSIMKQSRLFERFYIFIWLSALILNC